MDAFNALIYMNQMILDVHVKSNETDCLLIKVISLFVGNLAGQKKEGKI